MQEGERGEREGGRCSEAGREGEERVQSRVGRREGVRRERY